MGTAIDVRRSLTVANGRRSTIVTDGQHSSTAIDGRRSATAIDGWHSAKLTNGPLTSTVNDRRRTSTLTNGYDAIVANGYVSIVTDWRRTASAAGEQLRATATIWCSSTDYDCIVNNEHRLIIACRLHAAIAA